MRSKSKLSIKIPKLMVKTMHGRSRRTKRGNQFPKKVVSVFSSVFGNNKTHGKKDEDQSYLESLIRRKERHFTAEGSNLVHGNERIVGPLSQLLKLEVDNTSEPHDAIEEGKQKQKQKHLVLPLTSFVHKSCCGQAARDSADVVSGWRLMSMKVRSCHLVRVLSRIVTITSSLKKKGREQVEDDRKREEDEEEACLWKKRILMGGRCKPLYSSSGSHQYDTLQMTF